MANAIYDKARETFLGGGTRIDMSADTIKLVLVDNSDYTVDLVNHDFFNDVAAAGRVAISGALSSKTVTAGVFDAADVTLSAVSGDPSESIIIYKDTGTESTSNLIAYIDTATGLPITPNGADINIVFDNGANKIFKL